MSSSERRKRVAGPGVKGWEEAGGEFYQECYPGADVDLEMMKQDPHKISTLLPSKKNRTGTITINKKDSKLATLRYRTCAQAQSQATVVRPGPGPNNDVQIAFMPDLSENLSNEELLWEEIMKIKAMPVNMAQKKEMKARLLSRDTLRLQGFKQFKWKQKKTWINTKVRLKEMNEKLTLWRNSLKKIEGYHGTGVMSFFIFVKWLVFLNIVISLIICVFVIAPTMHIKSYVNLANYTDGSGNGTDFPRDKMECINSMVDEPFLQFIVGNGWVFKIPLYYNYYEDGVLDFNYIKFNLSLAYIFATFFYFLYSFVVVLKNAAHGFKHRLLESQEQFYLYCNILFSGWDFCIRNKKCARIKHKALYNEIIGRLNVERRKEEEQNRTKEESCLLFMTRLAVNAVVLTLLTAAGVIIYLSFKYAKTLPTYETSSLQLAVEFAPTSFIVGFNVILPMVFHWLGTRERYSPLFTVQITVFRTILLRYSSLCVLLASFYQNARTENSSHDCWEISLAQELYKLLMLSMVTQVFVTFFINFPRSFFAKHSNSRLVRLLGTQEFHLPTHVLDVVYIQTIIWLGSFYAPLLPSLGVVFLFVTFYIKKFACLVNCKPASELYYASRSNSLFMFILLFSFAFSVIPWAYSIAEITPSKVYGPFRNYQTAWSVVESAFEGFPAWIHNITTFCISSTFVVPLFILLILANYYYYAIYVANKQMVAVLKKQLVLEGHDKQFLLNRLSAFIKQQQEYYKPVSIDISS